MANDSRACGTCTYFDNTAEAVGEGECRRYAPRPVSDRRETMWVSVSTTDWCGEYSAAS